jgi:hypothetical protein
MITDFSKYYPTTVFDPSREKDPGYLEWFRGEIAEEDTALYTQFRADIECDYGVAWFPQVLLDKLFEITDGPHTATVYQRYQEYGRLVELVKLCQEVFDDL